jgi:hypothetical protein
MRYDAKDSFVDNLCNNYTSGRCDAPQYSGDGSLDIEMQNQSPSKGKETRWRPAPSDEFVLRPQTW